MNAAPPSPPSSVSNVSKGPGPEAVSDVTVRLVTDPSALTAHIAAWEDLATHAAERNVFYEPWMLLPAVEELRGPEQLLFLLVYDRQPNGHLLGLFPLAWKRRHWAMPIRTLTLWRHTHCYLCTPLVRAGYGAACARALFDWLGSAREKAAFITFPLQTQGGSWHRQLIEHFHQQDTVLASTHRHTRAFFEPEGAADSYLAAALPGKSCKELRRQGKRLSECGYLECVQFQPGDDIQHWIDDFLRVEAGGWKGRQGTALANQPADRAFFRRAVTAAHERGRLLLTALRLDGRPVAMKCNLTAGAGAFSFKIAFDEEFARFSPGVLLEIDTIRRLHESGPVRWMDSCAEADHSMINRLWTGRRTIETLVASTGRPPGDLLVAALPLFKWLKQRVRRLAGRFPGPALEKGQ